MKGWLNDPIVVPRWLIIGWCVAAALDVIGWCVHFLAHGIS